MYPDLETLEARFRTALRAWEEAKCHDDKAKIAKVAKEIATEYRKRFTEYKVLNSKRSIIRD